MENVKLGFYFPGGDFLHDFAVIQVEILASGVSPHKANKGKIRYRVRKGEVLWKADPSFKHKGMDEFCYNYSCDNMGRCIDNVRKQKKSMHQTLQ